MDEIAKKDHEIAILSAKKRKLKYHNKSLKRKLTKAGIYFEDSGDSDVDVGVEHSTNRKKRSGENIEEIDEGGSVERVNKDKENGGAGAGEDGDAVEDSVSAALLEEKAKEFEAYKVEKEQEIEALKAEYQKQIETTFNRVN